MKSLLRTTHRHTGSRGGAVLAALLSVSLVVNAGSALAVDDTSATDPTELPAGEASEIGTDGTLQESPSDSSPSPEGSPGHDDPVEAGPSDESSNDDGNTDTEVGNDDGNADDSDPDPVSEPAAGDDEPSDEAPTEPGTDTEPPTREGADTESPSTDPTGTEPAEDTERGEPDLFADHDGADHDVDHGEDLTWNLGSAPGIDAHTAWERGVTGAGTVVAVIDSGVDVTHPGLVDRVWSNPAGTGWNFLDDNGDVSDDTGHGTHIAGIVAQVAPDAKILPLKVIGPEGGYSDLAAVAIRHAVDAGADVINASWSLTGPSTAVDDAIAYARDAGVLFVTSAGSGGIDVDEQTVYPAVGPANVVMTTAVDRFGALVAGSNTGSVVVGAPGDAITAALPGGSSGTRSGSSVAAAHATGLAALAMSSGFGALEIAERLHAIAPSEQQSRTIDTSVFLADADGTDSPTPGPNPAETMTMLAAEAFPDGFNVLADGSVVVTNTNDSGPGSLRQAVANANADAVEDTITFDPSLTGSTIVLTSGEISVSQPVIVDGSGAPGVKIDGNQSSRIFLATADLTLRYVTIQNGRGPAGVQGGGVRTNSGDLTVEDSIIQYNTSQNTGGGLYLTGGGDMTVVRSLIFGNVAQSTAGGGGLKTNNGDMILRHTTVAQNTSPGHGGGLHFHGAADRLYTYFSTIIYNESAQRAANIDFTSGTWTASIGTVVGFPVGGGTNCNRTPGSTSYNYEVGQTSCGFNGATDVSNGADPLLGPLAENGGPTRSYAPTGSSPLIDAVPTGATAQCSSPSSQSDQRGVARPQGTGCEIGSVEIGLGVSKSSLTVASGSSGNRQTVQIEVGTAQTNLTMTDTVSSDLTVTNVTATDGGDCSATAGNDVSCTWASVSGGTTVSARITFSVPVDVPEQTIINTARVFSDQVPSDSAATATGVVTVLGVFDVATTFLPPVVASDTGGHTFEIDVENLSAFSQTSVLVTNSVDAALTVTGATADSGGNCSATVGNEVSCTWPSLASGAIGKVTVTYAVPATTPESTITNTVSVDSAEALPVTASATVTIGSLAIEKNFLEKFVAISGTGYTIDLAVTAVGDQTGVVVTDTVHPSFTVTNVVADNGGDCSATVGNAVSCTWATLSAGTTGSVVITYNAPSANQFVSVLTNTASAVSDQSPSRSDSDTVTVTNIVVTNEFAGASVEEGSTGNTFTVSVRNTLDTSQAVSITDSVPSSLDLTGAVPSAGGNCSVSGNSIACSWTSVPANGTVSVVGTFGVPLGTRGTVTNTGFGSASQTTPVPASATVTIDATSASLIVETRTDPTGDATTPFDFAVASTGGTAIDPFTITGEDASESFVVLAGTYEISADLPTGWSVSSVTGLGGTCDLAADTATVTVAAGDVVTCRFLNAVVEPARITIRTATVPGGGTDAFGFSATGPTPINSFQIDGEGTRTVEVAPGSYNFTQSAPTGWSLSDVTGDGGTCTRSGTTASVTIAAGEQITCTFTSSADATARLTIRTATIPSGNTTAPFLLRLDGPTAVDDLELTGEAARDLIVLPGSYEISGSSSGWNLSSATGDCSTDGSVVLAADDEMACVLSFTAGSGPDQTGGEIEGPGGDVDDPLPPGSAGEATVPPGTFGPNQAVEIMLCPTGERTLPPCVMVGSGTSGADGSADLEYLIPADTPAGLYDLVLTDVLGNRTVLSIWVGAAEAEAPDGTDQSPEPEDDVVDSEDEEADEEPDTPALAVTGSTPSSFVLIALLLILMGVALTAIPCVVPATRRSRSTDSISG